MPFPLRRTQSEKSSATALPRVPRKSSLQEAIAAEQRAALNNSGSSNMNNSSSNSVTSSGIHLGEDAAAYSLQQLHKRNIKLSRQLADQTADNQVLRAKLKALEQQQYKRVIPSASGAVGAVNTDTPKSGTTSATSASSASSTLPQLKARKLQKQVALQQRIIDELMKRKGDKKGAESSSAAKEGNSFRALSAVKRTVQGMSSTSGKKLKNPPQKQELEQHKRGLNNPAPQETVSASSLQRRAQSIKQNETDATQALSPAALARRDFVNSLGDEDGCWEILQAMTNKHAQLVFRMEQQTEANTNERGNSSNSPAPKWKVVSSRINALKRKKKRDKGEASDDKEKVNGDSKKPAAAAVASEKAAPKPVVEVTETTTATIDDERIALAAASAAPLAKVSSKKKRNAPVETVFVGNKPQLMEQDIELSTLYDNARRLERVDSLQHVIPTDDELRGHHLHRNLVFSRPADKEDPHKHRELVFSRPAVEEEAARIAASAKGNSMSTQSMQSTLRTVKSNEKKSLSASATDGRNEANASKPFEYPASTTTEDATSNKSLVDYERAQRELDELEKQLKIKTHVNSYLSKVNAMVQHAPEDSLRIPKDAICQYPDQRDTSALQQSLTSSSTLLNEHRQSAELAYKQVLSALQNEPDDKKVGNGTSADQRICSPTSGIKGTEVEATQPASPPEAPTASETAVSDDDSSLSSGSHRRARKHTANSGSGTTSSGGNDSSGALHQPLHPEYDC